MTYMYTHLCLSFAMRHVIALKQPTVKDPYKGFVYIGNKTKIKFLFFPPYFWSIP